MQLKRRSIPRTFNPFVLMNLTHWNKKSPFIVLRVSELSHLYQYYRIDLTSKQTVLTQMRRRMFASIPIIGR